MNTSESSIDNESADNHLDLTDDEAKIRTEQKNSPSDATKVVATVSATQFSGPIPHPDILKQYNEIDSGFADRIISMAEHQSEHRRKQEEQLLNARQVDAKAYRNEIRRGQYCGLVVAGMAILTGAAIAIWQPTVAGAVAAAIFGTSGMASVITAFFVEQRKHGNPQGKSSSSSEDS